jgi:hypothetical protein
MKKIFMTVLAFLHIQAFAQDKDGNCTLTEEQKDKLIATYGDGFSKMFVEALSKDPDGTKTEASVLEVLNSTITKVDVANAATALQKTTADKALADLALEKAGRSADQATIVSHLATIAVLSARAELDPKPGSGLPSNSVVWIPKANDTHLFGQDTRYFAIDDEHPYNQRLFSDVMARKGIIIPAPKASSTDYSSLKTDLGAYYRTRMMDRIQSFLVQLPNLTSIFPMVSNLTDQSVLTNVFMTEYSQAYNPGSQFGNLVKGTMKFEDEKVLMFDGVFAHIFQDMKEVEKTWLGYINNEGSKPIKLALVEFLAVEIMKALMNELNIRRIKGVYKVPTLNVPSPAINLSDGLLKRIKVWIANFQIKPFAVGDYTPTTISKYVKALTLLVPETLRNSGSMILYMSTDNVSAYISNNETLYGLNQDYKAGLMYVHEFPAVKIVGITGMAPSKRMIFTLDGNIILGEGEPGEMMNINFEQQDWILKAWSNWKETVWAYRIGRKYNSLAEMPNDYSTQLMFTNDMDEPSDYFINMAANDDTPSVINCNQIVSVANSQATAITNITDAQVGIPVSLKCGNATNPVTIAAAGNFSLLTAPWTPVVGDQINLVLRSDGKFIELKRMSAISVANIFADGDATPTVAAGDTFVTSANTAPLAITNLTNAIPNRIYTIYGGSGTNSTTIANAGNFVLTAAMTLGVGNIIKLQKSESNSKFYEISRV